MREGFAYVGESALRVIALRGPTGFPGHPITPICVDLGALRPYLQGMSQDMSYGLSQDAAEIAAVAAQRRAVWPLIAVAMVLGALVALAVGLWIHYGTTVFFEIVRAGIAACF